MYDTGAAAGDDDGGSRPQFESHLERLNEPVKTVLQDLRKFALSLGANVIEEVRPHRIVYAKTLNFRTFLDIEPAGDRLVVASRAARNLPAQVLEIRTLEEAEGAKKQIAEAYEKIR